MIASGNPWDISVVKKEIAKILRKKTKVHGCRYSLFMHFLGSFLLQDMFLSFQVFAFEGQNMENARVGIKRVTGRIFIQDPFNPICFSEDSEKHIEVESIICISTSYIKMFWNLGRKS